jgi:group I intron endonuclease
MKPDYKEKGNASKSGVYRITNTLNNRAYYGSCKQFKSRFASHRDLLLNGKHGNRFLQADYNKCGPEYFLFEVLDVIPGERQLRLDKEQTYIDQFYDSGVNCYNLRKNATDTREGSKNTKATNPATDKRCRSPSPERSKKRSESMKQLFVDNPELREVCAVRTKEVRWKDHSVNVTVTNKHTGETVLITGALKQWCLDRKLNYKAFHQLVTGKAKFSNGWFLGTVEPKSYSQKGQVRKPLSAEHRAKIAGNKFAGLGLTNLSGDTLTIEANIKEQCRKLGLSYHALLRTLRGQQPFCGEWYLATPSQTNSSADSRANV